jgi:hypothetical protein
MSPGCFFIIVLNPGPKAGKGELYFVSSSTILPPGIKACKSAFVGTFSYATYKIIIKVYIT